MGMPAPAKRADGCESCGKWLEFAAVCGAQGRGAGRGAYALFKMITMLSFWASAGREGLQGR